jgi:DNA-binding transcriptional LysR family regulator
VRGITIRQLKIFTQVIEQGSFNRCANYLNISSVAITGHIKKLEQQLGHQLFKRSPGGVAVLTTEGKRDYATVVKLLANYADLFESEHTKSHRTINITIEAFAFQCMQKGIQQFKQDHPDVELRFEFEEVSSTDILKQLKSNSIDLGYFYTFDDDLIPTSDFICDVPLAVYVGSGHPLADKKSISIEELKIFEVLKTSKKNYLNKLFDRAFAEIGLSDLSVALETDNMSIFGTTLDTNFAFTCMIQWVEKTEYGPKLNRLNLSSELPSIQLRQIIRSPLEADSLIKEASQLFQKSILSL